MAAAAPVAAAAMICMHFPFFFLLNSFQVRYRDIFTCSSFQFYCTSIYWLINTMKNLLVSNEQDNFKLKKNLRRRVKVAGTCVITDGKFQPSGISGKVTL
jgi:hypothetical protein